MSTVNILSLSDEELETIAGLAALNYTSGQMAVYLDISPEDFKKALNVKDSKIKFYIQKGRLESKFHINKKLLDIAKTGNITAAQEYKKVIEAQDIEQIKRKFLYHEED